MMNKMKSSKVHLIKFLFLVPIVAGLLLAFRNKESYQIDQGTQVTKRIIVDTVPVPPVRSARPAFSQNISSITNIDDHITVKLKDGTTEKYNLNKAEEKAAFERKYGSMPEPSAPPVPPAIENNNSIVPLAPTPPTPPGDVDNVNSRRVVPPQPPVPPVVPNLPANVSSIHINNQNATIKLKNGKVEKYDLGNPDEKRIFEKKYGDVSPGRAPVVPVTPVEQK